jgi:hypothetical protein
MIVRFSQLLSVRSSQQEPNPEPKQGEQRMRTKIVPAVALSLMSFGAVANIGMHSAHAAPQAHAAGEEDGDLTTPDTVAGGGGGSTPSGGAGTGAGGMAKVGPVDVAPFVAVAGAGAALLGAGAGASALARRRRSVTA